jgi:4-diphosphocytidyl-2-C-methyl-D-erythritol kinase
MDCIELDSYAKVNLTLEVSGKRPDGYHDIDSVVQVIGAADHLRMSKTCACVIGVTVDRADVPKGRENLVHRACEEFIRATGVRGGVSCDLSKGIPPQAGLGGGSGNAAAAILGMDVLYDTGLSDEELVAIASKVGSDVPLFIIGGTVRIRGRGELVEPLPDAPEMYVVLVKPEVGVSTAWAYSELDRRSERKATGASDEVERAIRDGDRVRLIEAMRNDFDSAVSDTVDDVRRAKEAVLATGARRVMLCGSGSAVFGVFESGDEAMEAARKLNRRLPWVLATRTISRETMRQRLFAAAQGRQT